MNFFRKTISFFQESWKEALAIEWPTWREIVRQFVIVLIISSLIVLVLYTMDISFSFIITELKQLVR